MFLKHRADAAVQQTGTPHQQQNKRHVGESQAELSKSFHQAIVSHVLAGSGRVSLLLLCVQSINLPSSNALEGVIDKTLKLLDFR